MLLGGVLVGFGRMGANASGIGTTGGFRFAIGMVVCAKVASCYGRGRAGWVGSGRARWRGRVERCRRRRPSPFGGRLMSWWRRGCRKFLAVGMGYVVLVLRGRGGCVHHRQGLVDRRCPSLRQVGRGGGWVFVRGGRGCGLVRGGWLGGGGDARCDCLLIGGGRVKFGGMR